MAGAYSTRQCSSRQDQELDAAATCPLAAERERLLDAGIGLKEPTLGFLGRSVNALGQRYPTFLAPRTGAPMRI